MHDKNGNPIGISARKFETNISHSNDGEMVLSLNKDIGEMKFNDQLSNEDILNFLHILILIGHILQLET